MKKTLKALAIGLALTFATADLAQANSFNFNVQGTIAGVCEVTNESIAATTTVDLEVTTAQTVGDLTYLCINSGGFTRRIQSGNSGNLSANGQNIAYQVSHSGNGSLGFNPTQLTSEKVDNLSGSTAFAAGVTETISVTIPSLASGLFAGTYTDTVTVNVTAN